MLHCVLESGVFMVKADIIRSVKELMSRNLDYIEIAHRLHLDPYLVQSIIDTINGKTRKK